MACAALAGCGAPQPGDQAVHPTIVSLNPCTDAILGEVADPAQLLAISHYSQDPRATSMPLTQARQFRMTGGTVEEVLALGPEIVVASTFLSPATAQAFSRLGVRVERFGIASTVEESETQVRRLAQLAGHAERGVALAARMEGAVAGGTWRGSAVPTLLWQNGGIVPGHQTLIAQLLSNAGFSFQPAARQLGQGAYLPLEQILADPPRVVLAAGGERMLTHPALRKLRGTRYARIDPSLIYCGGPTVIRAAERLAALRHAIG